MNILLIEDNSILNDTITHYLKLRGDDVTSLEDGDETISVIDDVNFDLYIIDINIPKINGIEVLRYTIRT